LEGLALALKAPVTVNLCTEGTITDLPDGFIHAVIPHIVTVKESEYVSGDERGRDVDVDHGSCVDFTVIGRPVERQPPFYKRVRGVEVGADVTRRRFAAVFVADTEWNVGRASIVFEAGGDWVSRICRNPPQNARRSRSFGTSRRAHSNTHVTGSHVTTYG
jgi:hypothetical protein